MPTNELAIVTAIGLLPSPFPEQLFHKAHQIQFHVNELYYRITEDHEFLQHAYKDLLGEPWIRQQVELMNAVLEDGIRQRKTLIVARADYLAHQPTEGEPIELKQVEIHFEY